MDGIEALWAVWFDADTGLAGAGVVVFETGRMFGGDASYYYTGSYEIVGGKVIGEVKATHFNGPTANVFGPVNEIELAFELDRKGDELNGVGRVKGAPDRTAVVALRRLIDLP